MNIVGRSIGRITYLLLFLSISVFAHEKEIQEAREAAPPHIVEKASIMVWKTDKFVKVVKGSNNFVCLVLRDSKGRYEPSCLNQAAMEAIFPVYEYQTKMLQLGKPIDEIYNNIDSMHKKGKFPTPKPGALVYMMSPKNKFFDHFGNNLSDVPPHIMLYTPKISNDQLGFNGQSGLPHYYDEYPHLGVIHINISGR